MPNTIIITGNPIDGLQFIGPFSDAEDATMYAENNRLDADWWIGELQSQEEFLEGPVPT